MMDNKYAKMTVELMRRADDFDGNPGMMGTRLQLMHTSASFAIAASLQEIAAALREDTAQRRRDDDAVRMENGK